MANRTPSDPREDRTLASFIEKPDTTRKLFARRIGRAHSSVIEYYNYESYHESLNNLTPVDVYYGRSQDILDKREKIKQQTLAMRRQMYYDNQSKHLA